MTAMKKHFCYAHKCVKNADHRILLFLLEFVDKTNI
jgi:hypothetical protein